MDHRLAHRVGRTSQATPAAVDKSPSASHTKNLTLPSVLPQIDAIEALGIDPAATSPVYWRTLANRLSTHLPLPVYTVERRTGYLAREALQ